MELFRSSGLSCFMDIIASEITNTDDKYKKELFVASVNYCLFFFFNLSILQMLKHLFLVRTVRVYSFETSHCPY